MTVTTKNQIKAAEVIMKHTIGDGYISLNEIITQNTDLGLDRKDFEFASEFLQTIVGFIKIDKSTKDGYSFRLTSIGEQFKEGGGAITEKMNDEFEKQLKLQVKEEREEKLKSLQLRDLEYKLEVTNFEQLAFWKAQKVKNKQTTIISLISLILSVASFLKTCVSFR